MLGVATVPFDSRQPDDGSDELGRHFGTEDTVVRAPTGVFFGEPGKTVRDPYFGGEGPDRTGCTRCGACMVGCRVGAVNSLTKNYLWFAEKRGAKILPERQVLDVAPLGRRRWQRWLSRHDGTSRRRFSGASGTPTPQRGVVFAAGALGTNRTVGELQARRLAARHQRQVGRAGAHQQRIRADRAAARGPRELAMT